MQLYAPTSTTPKRKALARAGPRQLDGARIGILENGKLNAEEMLNEVAQLFVQRHGCTVRTLASKKNASAPAPANTLVKVAPGGRLPDHRPGGLRLLLNVQSARRHHLRTARQARGGALHHAFRGDGAEHRPRARPSRLSLPQGPAPDRQLHPARAQGAGRGRLPAGAAHPVGGLIFAGSAPPEWRAPGNGAKRPIPAASGCSRIGP